MGFSSVRVLAHFYFWVRVRLTSRQIWVLVRFVLLLIRHVDRYESVRRGGWCVRWWVAMATACRSRITCRQLLESVTCYAVMPHKTCVVVVDSELPVCCENWVLHLAIRLSFDLSSAELTRYKCYILDHELSVRPSQMPDTKSRTERHRSWKLARLKEAHDTGDPWPHFKVKRWKVKVTRPINAVTENQPSSVRTTYELQTGYTVILSTSYSWEGKGRCGSVRLRMNVWVCR